MRLHAFVMITVTAAGLMACGLDTNQQDQFEDKSKTKAEQDARAADATGEKDESTDTLDCEGIETHGHHLTCDKDDVAVRDQKDANNSNSKDNDTIGQGEGDAPSAGEPDAPADSEDNGGTPATPDADPNVVVFRIKAGTGNSGWNTQAEMIEAKVGQIIRVYNDDSIVHRLHTSGRPCPHGVNIPVGESRDCVVEQTFDSTTSDAVYDHIAGPSAKIWIRATN